MLLATFHEDEGNRIKSYDNFVKKCSGKLHIKLKKQNYLSRDVYLYMKTSGKTFSCPWLFTDYFTKELYQWEKTHVNKITLLMSNIVLKILIPQA